MRKHHRPPGEDTNSLGLTRRSTFKIAPLLAWTFATRGKAQLCEGQDIKNNQLPVLLSDEDLDYFISGPIEHGRGRLSVLLKIKQQPDRFVSRVVLTDELRRTVGVRYFGPTDRTSEEYPPYISFGPIDGRFGKKYELSIQVSEGAATRTQRYVFDRSRLTRSTLAAQYLPPAINTALESSHGKVITSSSFFSLPFYLQVDCPTGEFHQCLTQHYPDVQVERLNSPGTADGAFAFYLTSRHPDFSVSHYWRFSLITDPVGRVMAIGHRTFAGTTAPVQQKLSRLSPSERIQKWAISAPDEPNINDCPYVMVFLDDAKEALSMTTFGLE